MKKLLFLLLLIVTVGYSVKAQDSKDKVKKTSTIGQKIHNTFSRHKRHSGYKSKHTHHGVTHKHKVNRKTGEVKNKVTDQ